MIAAVARAGLIASLSFLVSAQRAPDPFLTYSGQGWTEADRNTWYTTSQGSRLAPLSWIRALERAQDDALFLTAENLARFRYLAYTTPSEQTGLPVGFAIDRQSDRNLEFTRLRWLPDQRRDEPWIGFTCAACHTGEIASGNRRLRIDGAPGMGDFQSFIEQFDRALAATRSDEIKFRRFAQRVLGARDDERNRSRLAEALESLIAYREQVAEMNQVPLRYGFSRVDAFGHIFNQASLFTGAGTPIRNEPSAPVSYPFLWNVPQHDRVQWNGSVQNRRIRLGRDSLDIGALGRNTGEVIGVFGEVITHRRNVLGVLDGFRSSIDVRGLVALETMLQRLHPPAWPEAMLGTIDRQAASRGQRLYERDCASCHVPLARTDISTPIVAQMNWFSHNAPPHQGRPNQPPLTDPVMACNAYYNAAASGRLEGYRSAGFPIGEIAPVLDMLSVTVLYAMANEWRDLLRVAFEIYEGGSERPQTPAAAAPAPGAPTATPSPTAAASDPFPGLPVRYRGCVNKNWGGAEDIILGYKARPLGGIWATGPYLHNGSVPNLYELLLPPAQRSTSFWTGTIQFDPRRVGYRTEPSNENSFLFRTRDERGAIIWGNFNGGHDYDNAALSERDRMDLVEYLKTL